MNISQINNVSNPSFNGKIITKGQWSVDLKKAFLENGEVKKLAESNKDILVWNHETFTAEEFAEITVALAE